MMRKRKLAISGIFVAISLSVILITPLYARQEFGENCLSCHTESGIAITSNITDAIEVNVSSSFGVQINAEGDAQELTIVWSTVANNPSFVFTPTSVIDNDINDNDITENKVNGIFEITTPQTLGQYTIKVFAAGSGGKGGTLTFQVAVKTEESPQGPSLENLLPTAYFLYTRHGMTLAFEDRSWDADGNITSWLWNFGDKTNSTEQNPTHSFAESGTYIVILTVADGQNGSDTHSQVFDVPSKGERFMLWILQVIIGSIIVVFTLPFAAGIAVSRKKEG